MEYSQPDFPMFNRIVCYFDTNISDLLLISFGDITGHSMGKSGMRKERNNIISTLSQRCPVLFEIYIQSSGILGNFNKKYLINWFSRTMWSCIAVSILTKWEMAYNFICRCWDFEGLNKYVEIAFD